MDCPVPTGVPPGEPEYHIHSADVPSEPPMTESVTGDSRHTLCADAVIPDGAVEMLPTVMTAEAQSVMLQEPSART